MRACGADPASLPNPVFSPKAITMGKYTLFFGKKVDFCEKILEKGGFGGENGRFCEKSPETAVEERATSHFLMLYIRLNPKLGENAKIRRISAK
jgi:hypothetical protein